MRDTNVDPSKCQSCRSPVLDGNGNPLPGVVPQRSQIGNFFLCPACNAKKDEIRNPLTGQVIGSFQQQKQAAQAARAQLVADFGPLANVVASLRAGVQAGQSAAALAPTILMISKDERVQKAPALVGRGGLMLVEALFPEADAGYRAQIAALIA